MNDLQLARGLAAFSIGLGLTELLAPRRVAKWTGIGEGHERLLQAMGLREVVSGIGILQGKPSIFLWSRVAGDVLDLGMLGAAWRSDRADRERLQIAIAAVAGVTVLDVAASLLQSRDPSEPAWRVASAEGYRAGFAREDPATSRAWCDEAMQRHGIGRETEPRGQTLASDPR